jgi:linear primary-alkylsulfatase
LPDADATLTMNRDDFAGMIMGGSTLDKQIQAGKAKVTGTGAKVGELLGNLDTFEPMFNIVTP